MASETTYRVGVDIGGTFTDIVLLGSDGTVHTKKISSSVDNYARAIVEGLERAVPRDRHLAGSAGRDPPRHDRRLQRHPRAQGRQGRAHHHQGLPRRAGDPHAAHAAPLRHRLGKAAAAGRALSAPRGGRARRRQGPRRARTGHRRCRERRSMRCLPRRSRRSPSASSTRSTIPRTSWRSRRSSQRKAPHLPVCISYEVLPEIKEYERTSTTVINAYVIAIVATYLAACARASMRRASRRRCC